MQIEDSGWRLRLFGRVELTGPTDVISNFGTSRAAKLFVLLALSRSGEMQRTQLADLLWPDDFYDSTRLRLRQEIHRLKRALEPAGDWISASTNSVSLDRSHLAIDLHARGRLDGKCPWPEGEFLAGWDDVCSVAERRNAEDIRVRAAIATATQKLELGNTQAALAAVSPLIDRHPLHEALRMTAVQAHARGGSLAAAVAEYQD
jgi:DNA-binding SARP family transcriptional activator